MPTSTKPRKPYQGNKHLLTSREYTDLNRRLFQVVQQLQQVQAVMMAMVQGPAANEPTVVANEGDLVVDREFEGAAEVSKEDWDAYEKDMAAMGTAVVPTGATAAEIDAHVQAAMAPQEAQ